MMRTWDVAGRGYLPSSGRCVRVCAAGAATGGETKHRPLIANLPARDTTTQRHYNHLYTRAVLLAFTTAASFYWNLGIHKWLVCNITTGTCASRSYFTLQGKTSWVDLCQFNEDFAKRFWGALPKYIIMVHLITFVDSSKQEIQKHWRSMNQTCFSLVYPLNVIAVMCW